MEEQSKISRRNFLTKSALATAALTFGAGIPNLLAKTTQKNVSDSKIKPISSFPKDFWWGGATAAMFLFLIHTKILKPLDWLLSVTNEMAESLCPFSPENIPMYGSKMQEMVHVDYKTQVRTQKLSYYWYKEVVKNNRVM